VLAVSRRIIVKDPHPISEVIGSVTFGSSLFSLKRGLLATLDAARSETPAALVAAFAAIMEIEAAKAALVAGYLVERVVLAALQVAWYEETQQRVPHSCQRTLAVYKEDAR
jgi:hypothetical protein